MFKTQTLLHNIQDYAPNGLEFAEINTRLVEHFVDSGKVFINNLSVPSLDTMALGFVTQQLALAPYTGRMVIYGNVAPRRGTDKAQKNNIDNGIKYAKLKNGVEIINVWSEYAFGFIKDYIVEFRDVVCPAEGSQFRSRDFFPERVARIVNADYSVLGADLPVADIPEIPNNLVAWIDGFGNIKTTMRRTDLEAQGLKSGDLVLVELNGVTMQGVVSVGGFTVDRGVLAVSLGSSGYENPFVELFLRVHQMSEKTAAVRFDHPVGGMKVEVRRG